MGLETFRDIARTINAGIVDVDTSKTVRLPAIATRSATSSACRRTTTASPASRERPRRRAPHAHEPRLGLRDQRPGCILTNSHVIEGADEINVSFPTASASPRRSWARTPDRRRARQDRAEGQPDDDPARRLGRRRGRRVGDGHRNPFGLPGGNSVTVGVVSFKGRDLELGVRRHLRRDDPDRRLDQPRQLGRPARSTPAARSSASTP